MLGVIFWMYGGYAWLTNSVVVDRLARRLTLAGFLVVALAVPGAFEGSGIAFGLAYLAVVLVHLGMFTLSSRLTVKQAILGLAPFNVSSALLVLVGLILRHHRRRERAEGDDRSSVRRVERVEGTGARGRSGDPAAGGSAVSGDAVDRGGSYARRGRGSCAGDGSGWSCGFCGRAARGRGRGARRDAAVGASAVAGEPPRSPSCPPAHATSISGRYSA